MTTAITIIAVLCIIASAWFAWHTKRVSERKLQRCLDAYEESNELRNKELQNAIHRTDEATSALAALKRSFEETVKEYEALGRDYKMLSRDYRKLQDDKEAAMKGIIDAGQPQENLHPSEPANKPNGKLRGRKTKK